MAKKPKLEYDFVRTIVEKMVTAPDEKARLLAACSKHLQEAAKTADQNKADNENSDKPTRVLVMTDRMLNSAADEKTGWIVDVLPKHDISRLSDHVQAAIAEFNASKKGKRNPVDSIGNAFEAISPKKTKEHGFHVKTRLPAALVVISAEIREATPVAAE